MAMRISVTKRQYGNSGYQDDGGLGDDGAGYDSLDSNDSTSWWWSPQGMAVRYAIVAILCAAFVAFFFGGYYHARHRVRRGLPPLAYHQWMVRRTYEPRSRYYAAPYYAGGTQAYGIQEYPPPPPAYNQHEAPPPVYTGPEGGSKVMPSQVVREVQTQGEWGAQSSEQAGVAAPPAAAAGQHRFA